ncbi:F-box protein At4g22280-like [Silene latifolia]|uniref:F-box protein At4g22280-like n=1 Tax=Silene latifolia TaxID=37657 RepID=UPI003D779472
MADYITELPDDILCYILSLLTVRDTFRVKSLSSTWKNLPDCRSVLWFDDYTILGKDSCDVSLARKSKFVKAVDQFLEIWRAQKTIALKIKFDLGNKYASHINGWIASVCDKEIEELDFDFMPYYLKARGDEYVFPFHLFDTDRGSCLKHLRLTYCDLRSICGTRTSWLSKLSTIELTNVPLHLSDLECILSGSLNLESLSMIDCRIYGYLRFQHPFLKKIIISEDCQYVELVCPRLETFDFLGRSQFKFVCVPLLQEVSLKLYYNVRGVASVFSDLAREVPQLETLSLWVNSEVRPLPPNVTMPCLKRLDLRADIKIGFNLFTITHFLYACPVLQELCLQVNPRFRKARPHELGPQLQYEDRPHFHLKEFKINGLYPGFSTLELIKYLLRNGVSLERMVFVLGAKLSPMCRSHPKFIMLQNDNPAVELICI